MKWIIGCLLLNLLLFPFNAGAKSFYSDGTVDNSSGTTNKDLVYRDFEVTRDGYVTGIGNMALKGKYEVREPYSPLPDDPSAVVFKFRLPGKTNFRNAGTKD